MGSEVRPHTGAGERVSVMTPAGGAAVGRPASGTVLRGAPQEQSFALAAIGGLAAAGVGAILWAVITVATGYQIGFMAIGVGLLVGYAVRIFGKGVDSKFGILGAALALAGCVAGNVVTACAFASRASGVPLGNVLAGLTPALAGQLLGATFQAMDLLFYGLAVYEGYRFSFRR